MQGVKGTCKKHKAIGIDVPLDGLVLDREHSLVRAHHVASRDDVVASVFLTSRQGHNGFDVVRLQPIVSVEETDGIEVLRNREEGSDATWRPAIIGVAPIELYMSNLLGIDPSLRIAIGHHDMFDRDVLPANAREATLKKLRSS